MWWSPNVRYYLCIFVEELSKITNTYGYSVCGPRSESGFSGIRIRSGEEVVEFVLFYCINSKCL
jgi:hypothetical protein